MIQVRSGKQLHCGLVQIIIRFKSHAFEWTSEDEVTYFLERKQENKNILKQ